MALAPRVVVLHTEADKGRTILMHERLGELEDQRVLGVNIYIHLTAQDEVPLRIALIDAVDERIGAKGITRIKRGPDVTVKSIADVTFKPGQGLLAQNFSGPNGRVNAISGLSDQRSAPRLRILLAWYKPGVRSW